MKKIIFLYFFISLMLCTRSLRASPQSTFFIVHEQEMTRGTTVSLQGFPAMVRITNVDFEAVGGHCGNDVGVDLSHNVVTYRIKGNLGSQEPDFIFPGTNWDPP